ncbi:MAG: hypothetical protein H6R25_3277 [Proteobacteria bacterium]|nr:hypothetical protein [Pseudomonadota bacterium]
MRTLIRTIIVVALLWIALLLSGYGVLIGSNENAGGLGLQCKYVTARGTYCLEGKRRSQGFSPVLLHQRPEFSGLISLSERHYSLAGGFLCTTKNRRHGGFFRLSEWILVITHLFRNLAGGLMKHGHVFMQTLFRET